MTARRAILAAVLGIAIALLGTASYAQTSNTVGPPFFPQTLPSNTVVGRTEAGIGPASAIPFATLGSLLSISSTLSVGSTVVVGAGTASLLYNNGGFLGS